MPLLTIKNSNDHVPPGTYTAAFSGIEPIETAKGAAWRWNFTAQDGRRISGISDAERPPSDKNRTGRWLAALSGKAPQDGVQVNTDDYVGRRYLLIVQPFNDKSRLETFSAVA